MSKSKITPIGQAIVDLIETWQIAKDSSYVQKPISYALYHVWKQWDAKEKPIKADRSEEDGNDD